MCVVAVTGTYTHDQKAWNDVPTLNESQFPGFGSMVRQNIVFPT